MMEEGDFWYGMLVIALLAFLLDSCGMPLV